MLTFAVSFCMLIYSAFLLSMNGQDPAQFEITNNWLLLGERSRNGNEEMRANFARDIGNIDNEIANTHDAQERLALLKIKNTTIKEFNRLQQEMSRTAQTLGAQLGLETRERQATERTRILTQNILQPKTAGLLGLSALGIFAAWHGTGLARSLIDQWARIPKLAHKTSLKSIAEKIKGLFLKEQEDRMSLDQIILSPTISSNINQLCADIKQSVEKNCPLRHFLFYGPPGTGKTILSMALAHESNLEFIYFSASKLELYSIEEALKQLVQLFEFASKHTKKIMIIIDEAEVLLGDRKNLSDKTLKLLDALLTYMGTESPHFMVVALTNKPHMFDSASLNRFGEKIKIDTPGFEERKKLFIHYMYKYFIASSIEKNDTRTFLQTIFSSRPQPRPTLTIDKNILSTECLQELAQKTEGFVGREIADLLLKIQVSSYRLQNQISKESIYSAINQKIKQKQELSNFKD